MAHYLKISIESLYWIFILNLASFINLFFGYFLQMIQYPICFI